MNHGRSNPEIKQMPAAGIGKLDEQKSSPKILNRSISG